jgi:hypothetical protein
LIAASPTTRGMDVWAADRLGSNPAGSPGHPMCRVRFDPRSYFRKRIWSGSVPGWGHPARAGITSLAQTF